MHVFALARADQANFANALGNTALALPNIAKLDSENKTELIDEHSHN